MYVSELKNQSGPQIQVHGSGDLIQTLLRNDLVDEFHVWTFPVVLGSGKRLFAGGGGGGAPRGGPGGGWGGGGPPGGASGIKGGGGRQDAGGRAGEGGGGVGGRPGRG